MSDETYMKIAFWIASTFGILICAILASALYFNTMKGLQRIEVRERALASDDQVHIERVFGHRDTIDRNTEINGDVIHGGEGLMQVSPLVLPRLGDL